jgi:hypothetical protein
MLGRDRIGIVLNEDTAWASADELDELGSRWVRTIVFDLDRFQGRLAELPPGIGVIALLNSETFIDTTLGVRVGDERAPGWEQRWSTLLDQFVARFGHGRLPGRRLMVECLNEWDIPQLPATIAVKSIQIAGPKLQAAGLGCLFGSVASGDWPQQLKIAVANLTAQDRDLLDGVCFHPYVKKVGRSPVIPAEWAAQQSLSDAVQTAWDIVNPPVFPLKQLPLWLTEFGLNRRDVEGRADVQSAYLLQAYEDLGAFAPEIVATACWFCWNDRTGICTERDGVVECEQFGLRPSDDALPPHPTRSAYIRCTFPGGRPDSGRRVGVERIADPVR